MLRKSLRRFTTILFLVAFFAPWLPSCGTNTANGFEVTLILGSGTLEAFNPINLKEGLSLLFVPIVFVGLTCTLLYALMNLLSSFNDFDMQKLLRWRTGTLIGAVLGMLGSIAWTKFSDIDLKDYLWGYWAAWGGLLLSIGLEIMENQASRSSASDK